MPDHRFCVAPMMKCTDRHDRVFLRLFTKRSLLYTEMITSAALVRGDADRLLRRHHDNPVALQLGGGDPGELAAAAVLGARAGYDEINLNVGCPSSRVRSGAFGACLMARPAQVAACVERMRSAVSIPVTVKCRTGIDGRDSMDALADFIGRVADGGCRTFVIHARKAVLGGLSPKENLKIPPLDRGRVFAVKRLFPDLEIVINGGITRIAQARELLDQVDGVMMGREAYRNPYLLREVDPLLFGEAAPSRSRLDYLLAYMPHIESELAKGTPLTNMTRHVLGLFKGQKGGRGYRRHLSECGRRGDAGIGVLMDALAHVA